MCVSMYANYLMVWVSPVCVNFTNWARPALAPTCTM